MNYFTKRKIISEKIWIIDIWSYKIRVWICEYKKDSIDLIAFSEKRQSSDDIVNNEIKNLEWLCENIELALKKAEKEANIKVDKIVLNPVFSDSFIYSKNISYHREAPLKIIDDKELAHIISKVEEIALHSASKNIEKTSLYKRTDLEIITSNISEITLDRKVVDSPIEQTWENLSFHLLNIFITKSNFELINYIWSYLNKEVVKILPEEFCLAKIWEKDKDVVIINIWNSSSYITIRDKNWNIIWTVKIWVWIETLINNIQKKSDFSRAEIIKKIDRDDLFIEEKNEFLDIYSFLISEWLKDIMINKVCPSNFFIVWWWWNNDFLKNHFKKLNWNKIWVKLAWNIKFIIPDVKKIWKIKNIENVLNKSNLNIISMILTFSKVMYHKNNIIEKHIKNAIDKIIYK